MMIMMIMMIMIMIININIMRVKLNKNLCKIPIIVKNIQMIDTIKSTQIKSIFKIMISKHTKLNIFYDNISKHYDNENNNKDTKR
jgi:hypothetical protein